MLHRIYRYLFPPIRPQSRLPLLSRKWSSASSVYGDPPDEYRREINILKGYSLARTDADAYLLLRQYGGQSILTIIRAEKRKRRRMGRLRRAWKRLKERW
jgi:hypothetical protein